MDLLKMLMPKRYRGAGVLFYHVAENGQPYVFLGKRAIEPLAGCWSIVDGRAEEGETYEQCAAREAKEETGASATVLGLDRGWMDVVKSSHSSDCMLPPYYCWRTFMVRLPAMPASERWPKPQPGHAFEFAELSWHPLSHLPSPLSLPARLELMWLRIQGFDAT